MRKILIFGGLGCAGLIGMVVVGFFVLASLGPDTSIYTGRQVPKRFVSTIDSLGLLEDDERIRYFYSDALFDIKDGFYFVTDSKLVVYSDAWAEPETIIPFEEIESLEAEYNDSFLTDSMVFVTTLTDLEVSFPVSSEGGLDKKFVQLIQEGRGLRTPVEAPAGY
ncbi:MAG: hypothetical protein AAF481_12090 [Acidobacteriota bacterium]